MTEGAAAVVVLAEAPRPGCKPRLEPLLGADGCARLQRTLVRRALAWAADVGTPYLAFTPADAHDELTALAPAGTRLFAQSGDGIAERVAAAAEHVFAEHGGPVLLVGADTPQIAPGVGRQALEDLRAGCDVSVGPTADGGFYLVGLREPHLDVLSATHRIERAFAVAHEAGLGLAMLRAERRLDGEDDVRALLADPLAPRDVADVLRSALQA